MWVLDAVWMRVSKYNIIRALEGSRNGVLGHLVRFIQFIPACQNDIGVLGCLDGHQIRGHWDGEGNGLLGA